MFKNSNLGYTVGDESNPFLSLLCEIEPESIATECHRGRISCYLQTKGTCGKPPVTLRLDMSSGLRRRCRRRIQGPTSAATRA